MPVLSQKRIIVTNLGLELLRQASVNILGEPSFGSVIEIQLITMAVTLAQLQRRPMSAAKLAEYIGMPRTTVSRKLRELEKAGVVERNGSGAFLLTHAALNRSGSVSFIDRAAQLIHTASKSLAKLDR